MIVDTIMVTMLCLLMLLVSTVWRRVREGKAKRASARRETEILQPIRMQCILDRCQCRRSGNSPLFALLLRVFNLSHLLLMVSYGMEWPGLVCRSVVGWAIFSLLGFASLRFASVWLG